MSDDKGGIDLSSFDLFQKRFCIALDMGLSGFNGQTFVHDRTEGELVDQPDVHTGN